MGEPHRYLDAIEKAAAILRKGKVPPRIEAERLARTLDAMALALMMGAMETAPTQQETRP